MTKLTNEEKNEIIRRYPNEPIKFLANKFNCDVSTIKSITFGIRKNNLEDRVYSSDYLCEMLSINETKLSEIVIDLKHKTDNYVQRKYNLTKYDTRKIIKTFNLSNITNLKYTVLEFEKYFGISEIELNDIIYHCKYKKQFTICKKFNITPGTYNAIINSFNLSEPTNSRLTPSEFMSTYELTDLDMRNAEIYLPHFGSIIYCRKFNVSSLQFNKMSKYFGFEKLPTEEKLCPVCMTNFRTEGYRSSNCKSCHTEFMSQYQKVYYPLKVENIKKQKENKIKNINDIIKKNSKPIEG